MILAIDSSSYDCGIWLIDDGKQIVHEQWQADRRLADELIGHLRNLLATQNKTWSDITGIAVLQGPGSFTGLRIGLTVMNTLADANSIPIVGAIGSDWLEQATGRLMNGENDELVMPIYGREANITKPRK